MLHSSLLASVIGLPLSDVLGDYNGLRMGTQEVTRWGMLPEDMPVLAELLCRVLVDGEESESVKGDVVAYREMDTPCGSLLSR